MKKPTPIDKSIHLSNMNVSASRDDLKVLAEAARENAIAIGKISEAMNRSDSPVIYITQEKDS